MAVSGKTFESFFKELDAISSPLRDQISTEQAVAAAAGTTVAAGGVAALGGTYSEKVLKKPREVVIYYTDPRRGTGHEAQGKAVQKKIEALGVKTKLVNFDTTFGDPKSLDRYNASFNDFRGDPGKSLLKKLRYVKDFVRFYGGTDKKKIRQAMSAPGVLPVFANPQLAWTAQRAGVPHGISMQTDQAPWDRMDPETGLFGSRQGRHIVSESAADEFFKQHPTLKSRTKVVSDLAIMDPPDLNAKMVDKITGNQILMDGKFNITVSGGAQGWDTDQITKGILRADLPEGTVIHVVTGGDKQPDGKILNTEVFKKVKRLKGRPGVEIRTYGWSPLRQMMATADLNVLRPHGTTITEATSAGKPFVMAIPDSPLSMELNDAHAAAKHTKQPAVTMDKVQDAVREVLKDYKKFKKGVASKAPGATHAAKEWAQAVVNHNPLKRFRFAGRGTQGVAKALLALSIPTGAVGAYGLHEKKAEENKTLQVGMGVVASGLLALGIASARRGRTLRSIEKRIPQVTTQSKKEFLDLLKPGDLILTQIHPSKKALLGKLDPTYNTILKSQGEMAHSAIYLGGGEISHIKPGGTWKGLVERLDDSYLKGDKSILVVRPKGAEAVLDIAKTDPGSYTYKMRLAERIGLTELLPETLAKKFFKKVDRSQVICTTMAGDMYARAGVKLPKDPGRMLALDFRKMSDPPVLRFQGTGGEIKTSPIQGAGFLIPGLALGGFAVAPEAKKMMTISKTSAAAFWEELEKIAWAPSPEQIHQLARMKGIESDSQLPGSSAFLFASKELTNKKHLDKMNADERRRVYAALMLA